MELSDVLHIGGYVFGLMVQYFLLRERIVRLEEKVKVHEKLHAESNETIGELNTSINTLNETLVELKTVIRERK